MEVYGQLLTAGLERRTSNPTGANLFIGRMWFRTDTNKFHVYDGTVVLEFADLTSAQTFQQKTLAGATISDFLQFTQQGSTPANPGAGSNRIYFKTDGTPYTLDSNGNELPLGAGGGGSKNYFEDTDAKIDSTVGNWLTDDGAGSPSGGLTLSLTAVAGELLAGANSLKIVKDAANRDGHFVKVLSKTIDPSDRGRPNYGSFEFRPGTGYVSSDLIWEVYDVTNAAVLYSGASSDLEFLNARGRFTWVTYLAETTEQVEFRLKVNNTNTNAFEVFADEFSFGPLGQFLGLPASEWEQFTATFNNTGGWTIGQNCQKRRIGDMMHVKLSLQFTGSGSGASLFSFNIPDGLTLKGSSLAAGPYMIFDFNDNNGHLTSFGQFSAGNAISFVNPGITGSLTANNLVNTSYIRAEFFIPISEWDTTNIVNTNQFSQQTMRASIYRSADQAIGDANQNTVAFNTVDFDKFGMFSVADNGIKILKDGPHKVTAKIIISGLSGDEQFIARILKNGSQIDRVVDRSPNSDLPIYFDRTFEFVRNDIITIAVDSSVDTNYTVRGGIADSFLQVSLEGENTFLGVVKNEEYLETLISSSTTTTLANTETDVVGSELPIGEGTWDIGYDIDHVTRNLTASNNTQFGSIMVTDDLDNRIPSLESLTGGVMPPNAEVNASSSKQKRITLTAPTTLKIRIASLNAAASGTFGVRASGNVTGSLPGDDSVSRFWARRVK